MKAEDCTIINVCQKIEMVRSHDFAGDWQCAEIIRSVCAECDGPQPVKIIYDESGYTSGVGICVNTNE